MRGTALRSGEEVPWGPSTASSGFLDFEWAFVVSEFK